MKIVTALFAPEDVQPAIEHLTSSGIPREMLSLISSAGEIPIYLEGEPEKSAVSGALLGAVSGGTIGALGSVVVSTIPGFDVPMLVSGLMSTTLSGVVGAYLGSLYSVRADTEEQIDVHEELEAGRILLLIKTTEEEADAAKELLAETHGEHVDIHPIPAEAETEEIPGHKLDE
ncbi:MAG: hypothetical protein IPM53_10620 [Anaerolineaceae bacterium]|nr:hypothetical protein [Anaerolineaceae bacterium]